MTAAQMEELLTYMQTRFGEIEELIKLGLVHNIIQELSGELEDIPTIKRDELYLQMGGREWRVSDWRNQAIQAFAAAGNEEIDVKEVEVYLKPEDHKGYYVINKEHQGSFDLQDTQNLSVAVEKQPAQRKLAKKSGKRTSRNRQHDMRLAKLRTITDEQEFIDHIDQIAFNQEELADLLDEDTTTIYLCGKKFTVPASRKGITYIGIKNPVVHISGKVPETAEELKISFRECSVDNLPRKKSAQNITTDFS